jgi:lysophospholipase L1-like esterase
MRILTFGDSFTYGDELDNLSDAWPYVLGNLTKCLVKNLGKSAISNDYIVRNVIEHATADDIVIIAWTHYARIEFADEKGIFDIWPGCQNRMFNHPDVSYRKELINYYSRYNDNNYSYSKYIDTILLLQAFFKYNNTKYVMLDTFENNNFRNLINEKKLSMIDKNYYLGWPNETMMEWTNGYTQGPGGHFLEAGHQRVAEKINEHIRNLGWVS